MDHVPDRLVEGGVDGVGRLRARVGKGAPAHAVGSANHDGGRAGKAAGVPPVPCSVVADHPAARVFRVGILRIGGRGCGHELDRFGLENTRNRGRTAEMRGEFCETAGRGDPAAVGIHAAHVHVVGIFVELAEVFDFVGSAVAVAVAGDAHVGDAAGRENGLLDEICVGLAGDFLDDAAKDAVAEIGVSPMRTRRIGERESGNGFGDEFFVVPGIVVEHGIGVVVGPAAGGVGKEMVDGDVGDVLAEVFAVVEAEDAAGAEDFVVEIEFALLEKREGRDRGDRLGDAGDAEEASVGAFDVLLGVGHPPGALVDKFGVADDGDGERGGEELAQEVAADAEHGGVFFASGEIVAASLRRGGGEEKVRGRYEARE